MYPLVTDLRADGIPVALTCRVLGFSKQAYYKWRANPVTQRDWDDGRFAGTCRPRFDRAGSRRRVKTVLSGPTRNMASTLENQSVP